MNTIRPRLTVEENEWLQKFRAQNKGLSDECDAVGIDLATVKHYWYKGKNYSINAKGNTEDAYDLIRSTIIDEIKEYSPNYPAIKYSDTKEGHLLLISPADVHIGKLCSAFETKEDYNSQIAVTRVIDGVTGVFFKNQDVQSLIDAVERFEKIENTEFSNYLILLTKKD
jgi:hypothetical protein